MSTTRKILLVEDDPMDVELSLTALSEYKIANCIDVARDGAEALDYLFRRGNFKTRDELNRPRRADAAARLAERTVGRAGRVVFLDGIERADVHTALATDARVCDLPLADSQQVAHREQRTARTDIAAPEPAPEQTEGKDHQEQGDRKVERPAHGRQVAGPFQDRQLQPRCREHQPASQHGDRRNETG